MTNNAYDLYLGCKSFDEHLETIEHFKNYPEMLPWVGKKFMDQKARILIIGESHYFSKGTKFHHDDVAWYAGQFSDELKKKHGHRVRFQVSKSCEHRFHGKETHNMHKIINKYLVQDELVEINTDHNESAFDAIAYVNYFQRPAQKEKDSLVFSDLDNEVAKKTISGVIEVLKPNAVMFVSVKSYKAASSSGLLKSMTVPYDYSPHPCNVWWNRPSKKYGNIKGDKNGAISGSKRFTIAMKNMLQRDKAEG